MTLERHLQWPCKSNVLCGISNALAGSATENMIPCKTSPFMIPCRHLHSCTTLLTLCHSHSRTTVHLFHTCVQSKTALLGHKWYSYNIGNVHVVSLSSGVVTAPLEVTNTSRYRWNYPRQLLRDQFTWLQNDVILAKKTAAQRHRWCVYLVLMSGAVKPRRGLHLVLRMLESGCEIGVQLCTKPKYLGVKLVLFVPLSLHELDSLICSSPVSLYEKLHFSFV